MKVSIFWFRRDLRLEDNLGLLAALEDEYPVLPLFIFDNNILKELPRDDARLTFIYDSLKDMDDRLKEQGASLLCRKGKPVDVWKDLLQEFDITVAYTNKDYEPYARIRDKEVSDLLEKEGIALHRIKDQVIFEEKDILKDDGDPYVVYTPYKNKWLEHFDRASIQPKAIQDYKQFYQTSFDFPNLADIDFKRSSIEVKPYDLSELQHYKELRDFPSEDATSYLSPHLRFGTVSVRQIIATLKPSDETFLSELIWREFFMQILYHFPKVVKHNFRAKYDDIAWRNNEKEFQLWCEGKTGYPMVDAGMRQLNKTGYMHNRVRMIVAGFLCKHLLIDWRWGEAYFAKKLLDYDLSANNGNWQWAAGTGCDAAPYFRIFNPITQFTKFDKKEAYVKKWVPEYNTKEYPEPMVEHKMARERALETYKQGIK
ncbi:deoxyribodipyrimidine photo-lyase [Aureispira sp. CCB-E]|uniref:cryptochrome/photolyase family protein n=1 Tax=Aureispira sp. CCB-E TaxID=3051121 RepID=UPI002869056E|nr:deoxyribodipyrimidine photo-lyase [Aureispira sp. CCB-E]WMX13057.1 deoxyribodipyrimidine photo-lyase [Aureispira sp. CCB-E]